jgi:argonaute-like protein implicated in RNA metabolism and viral defense
MPIFNCSESTMNSIIAMNYLSGVISFKMLPDEYNPIEDKFNYKFELSYNRNNKIETKTVKYEDMKTYMDHLKKTSDLLDTISFDIREGHNG